MSRFCFALFVVVLCTFKVQAASDRVPEGAPVLVLAADVWCPASCSPKDTDRPGILVEIAKLLFEPHGYKIDYRVMPWTRALKLVQEGAVDGILGAEEYPNTKIGSPYVPAGLNYPLQPLMYSVMGVMVRKGKIKPGATPDDLAALKVAVVNGYTFRDKLGAYIEQRIKNNDRIYLAEGPEAAIDNITKLKAGAVDGVIDDVGFLSYQLKNHKMEDGYEVVQLEKDGHYLHIAFSATKDVGIKLVKVIDQALRDPLIEAKIASIHKKYGVTYKRENLMRPEKPAKLKILQ